MLFNIFKKKSQNEMIYHFFNKYYKIENLKKDTPEYNTQIEMIKERCQHGKSIIAFINKKPVKFYLDNGILRTSSLL